MQIYIFFLILRKEIVAIDTESSPHLRRTISDRRRTWVGVDTELTRSWYGHGAKYQSVTCQFRPNCYFVGIQVVAFLLFRAIFLVFWRYLGKNFESF